MDDYFQICAEVSIFDRLLSYSPCVITFHDMFSHVEPISYRSRLLFWSKGNSTCTPYIPDIDRFKVLYVSYLSAYVGLPRSYINAISMVTVSNRSRLAVSASVMCHCCAYKCRFTDDVISPRLHCSFFAQVTSWRSSLGIDIN